jgi:glycosyltransferase involved in cell wall biosynthesis
MRILVFHSYLLRGTGSNIYNANLVRALAALGHEVHLFCQDRSWEPPEVSGSGSVTVHIPDIGRVLPVYVADTYEGFEAKPYPELTEAELEHYLAANVDAVRAAPAPDIALANHLVMGPVILARADVAPYAVKIHGSALEYTVKPHPERFMPYALEGIRPARGVLVGSEHTAGSLFEALPEEPTLPDRTRLGPPGVDIHEFRPREPDLEQLASRPPASWGGEQGSPEVLRELDLSSDRIVSYVGKLIVSMGVDLLLAAWPLVVSRVPDARLVMVGFGTYYDALVRFVEALAGRDVEALRDIAARGRELEGGPAGELRYLNAFLDTAGDEWLRAAPEAAGRIHFTGRLEHEDLPLLLPACEAQVMPSTFPESFGMVAAEAAACGALPLSANHTGMAEVTATLRPALPEHLRPLMSFDVGPEAVREIGSKLVTWLELDSGERDEARAALASEAARRYSWESVAKGVIEAASGRS